MGNGSCRNGSAPFSVLSGISIPRGLRGGAYRPAGGAPDRPALIGLPSPQTIFASRNPTIDGARMA